MHLSVAGQARQPNLFHFNHPSTGHSPQMDPNLQNHRYPPLPTSSSSQSSSAFAVDSRINTANRPDTSGTMSSPSGDYQSDGETGETKKRQRIQQACKSCGIKRVKCDGQLPCVTCVRTGETCEYGMPKKRGPPKGSSRAPAKNGPRRSTQQPITQQVDPFLPTLDAQQRPQGLYTHQAPLPPSYGSSLPQQHFNPLLPPPASMPPLGPETTNMNHRPNYGYAAPLLPPKMEFPALDAPRPTANGPPFAAYGPPAPYTQLPQPSLPTATNNRVSGALQPPELPRASVSLMDPHRGSYVSLPNPSGSSQSGPKFRGGSSGILDFPRLRGREPPFFRPGSGQDGTDPPRTSSPATYHLAPTGVTKNGSIFAPRAIKEDRDRSAAVHTRYPSSTLYSAGVAPDPVAEAILDEPASRPVSPAPWTYRDPEIPIEIEDRCWLLFWQIIALHWPILLKRTLPFIRGRHRVDPEQDPLLHNAVMSLASRIWDVERDGPLPKMRFKAGELPRVPTVEEVSDIYFTRARYWLVRTDNESTVPIAQALLILSLRESGCGRSSQAAQHAMSACRVALDIGLHRDLASTGLPHDETQTRLRLWWAIYVLDKTSAAQLGRTCILRYSETDAPFFDVDEKDELEGWQPCDALTRASDSLAGQPTHTLSHFLAGCKLAAICEDVILQYNSIRPKAGDARGSAESWDVGVARLHARLEEWQSSLPAELRIQQHGPTFQHILCQQMWFQACRIILHRPHILKTSDRSDLPKAHQTCTDSATQLVRLAGLYQRDHGIKKLSSTVVYCVFTAAIIFVANSTSPDPSAAEEGKARLKDCCDLLGAMGGTWTNANVHLNILKILAESLEADIQGTGLSGGDSANVSVNGYDSFDGNANGSMSNVTRVSPVASFNGYALPSVLWKGEEDGVLPQTTHSSTDTGLQDVSLAADSSPASTSLTNSLFAVNDENYWGSMPLSSENQEAWAVFTSRYLDSLNTVGRQQQQQLQQRRLSQQQSQQQGGGYVGTGSYEGGGGGT